MLQRIEFAVKVDVTKPGMRNICYRETMALMLLFVALWSFPLECKSQDRSVVQKTIQYLQGGNPRKAVDLLRPVVQHNAKDAYTHYLLGVALSELGERQESDQFLRRALQLDPSLTEALRFLGINAFFAGNLTSAKQNLERFLRKAPSDGLGHVYMGQTAFALQDFPLAIRHFRQSEELLRREPHLQLLYSQALVGARLNKEAQKVLLEIRSDDPVLAFQTGTLLAKLGMHDEAVARYAQARPQFPGRRELDFNAALSYFRMGDYSKVVSLLKPLARENLADADVYSLLADALRRLAENRGAYEALRKAVTLAPEEQRHWMDFVALCIELGEIESGIEVAHRSLKQHPKSHELYGRRALLYSLKGDYKEAEADYRKALQLGPKDPEWLYSGLAMMLMFQDRLDEAKDLLEDRLETFKDFYTYYNYSEVLRRLGSGGSASADLRLHQVLEKSVQLNPNFAPARLNLGRVYAMREEWTNAITQLEAATNADPSDKRAYYELSRIYQRLGKEEKAREMLAVFRKVNEQKRTTLSEQTLPTAMRALKRAAQSGDER